MFELWQRWTDMLEASEMESCSDLPKLVLSDSWDTGCRILPIAKTGWLTWMSSEGSSLGTHWQHWTFPRQLAHRPSKQHPH